MAADCSLDYQPITEDATLDERPSQIDMEDLQRYKQLVLNQKALAEKVKKLTQDLNQANQDLLIATGKVQGKLEDFEDKYNLKDITCTVSPVDGTIQYL